MRSAGVFVFLGICAGRAERGAGMPDLFRELPGGKAFPRPAVQHPVAVGANRPQAGKYFPYVRLRGLADVLEQRTLVMQLDKAASGLSVGFQKIKAADRTADVAILSGVMGNGCFPQQGGVLLRGPGGASKPAGGVHERLGVDQQTAAADLAADGVGQPDKVVPGKAAFADIIKNGAVFGQIAEARISQGVGSVLVNGPAAHTVEIPVGFQVADLLRKLGVVASCKDLCVFSLRRKNSHQLRNQVAGENAGFALDNGKRRQD